VVYGDVRTRHDVHRRVIVAVLKSGVPDLVLHTGDLVENGNHSALWATFFDIERELLRQTAAIPMYWGCLSQVYSHGPAHGTLCWGNP
jgi:hypothetical protein